MILTVKICLSILIAFSLVESIRSSIINFMNKRYMIGVDYALMAIINLGGLFVINMYW